MNYRSNLNIVYSCKYHVVWCPKYRRKVLMNGADVRLKELIHEAVTEHRADILGREVMSDHVHLLVEIDPRFGTHRLVRLLKGRSSRKLAARAFAAVDKVALGKARNVRFKGRRGLHSLEGKTNTACIRWRDDRVLWNGLELTMVKAAYKDPVIQGSHPS